MIKYLLCYVLTACALSGHAQEIRIGAKLQKSHNFYWENGLSVRYQPGFIPIKQLVFGVEYQTTRLGSAISSNAMEQGTLLGTASWYFRKNKALQPVYTVGIGLFSMHIEEELFQDIPDQALVLASELGLSYNLPALPLILQLSTGIQTDFLEEGKSPGTLQPLYYNFRVFYRLKK